MITAMLILFAVLLATGFIGTVVMMFHKDTGMVYRLLLWNNLGNIAELLATVVSAILSGFSE
jgi:hypothetical protein